MPLRSRDRLWFYLGAAWMCHSRGRVRHGAPSSPRLAFSRSLSAAGMHLTTPALREAPAGGGWLGRKPLPVPQGQAVTAGKGPSCHTKALCRRFLPQTYRRPGLTFSLESRPVSFSAEKEMDLAPAAGAANPFRLRAGLHEDKKKEAQSGSLLRLFSLFFSNILL